MDALDMRILRAMGPLPYNERANGADTLRPARIARDVGVTPETVRERIARLEATGVIEGYEIIPNLRHLGLQASAYLVRAPDEDHRDRLRQAGDTIDGLLEVTFFLGTEACVDLSYETEGQRERRVRALANLAGDETPLAYLGWASPPVERKLTPLDWRILQALRGRAKRSLVDVAEEIGVGYRTVKRHYDRMAAENSFLVKPILNPATEPGFVPFTLLLHFDEESGAQARAAVLRELSDHLAFAQTPTTSAVADLDVLVYASSPAHAETLRQKAAAVPGVTRVRALAPIDVIPHAEWIDELIAARAAAPP